MEVIIKPIESIWKIMGNQKRENHVKYRPITYCKKIKTDNGWILYHTITREIILLNSEEHQTFLDGNSKQMIEHWFLVPDKVDDASLLYMFFRAYETRYPRRTYGKLNLCTIATTTDCNARCPYCYEAGIERKHMSQETAEDVAKFIIERANPNITLNWFGGEPLYNAAVIDTICGKFQSKKFPFRSTMVSNGYLFKDIPINKIKNLWNLKRVQITLDGMENTYNSIKAYTYKDDNPFFTVTDNIEKLLDADIFVNIRLNLSEKNIDEMFSLVEWLDSRYPNKKNLGVYSRILFDITGSQREQLFGQFLNLQELIRKLGLVKPIRSVPGIKRCHCMADDGRSVVINPDGDLSLCEHFLDSESYGSICSNKADRNVLNKFLERQEMISECKTCFYLPQCIRLKMCVPEGKCDEENRKLIEWQTEKMMIDVYKTRTEYNENNHL